MCGIAGFEVGEGRDTAPVAKRLLETLRARGPDSEGYLRRGALCMVQTRLAVIDLSDRVSYPMPNETEDVWLIFNGEIYDHRSLRRDLEAVGHRFRSDCDAEVVIHAYEEWGLGSFRRLNGMFALALHDQRSAKVILARDPAGIKPLVKTTEGRFAFASDAMALVAAGLSPGEIDRPAIDEYAAFHYLPHPRTGIVGLEQVEPGTAVVRAADGSERVEHWASRPFSGAAPTEPVGLDEVEAVLRASVERHLVADVDVGVFLSGGVDSSLVLALASEAGARPHSFTIGFPGHGDYDESAAAAGLAKAFGAPHHRGGFDSDFGDAVADVAAAYDHPFADASALATLALARMARDHVTVALSGTGGDDLFAGYYRHRAHRLRRPLSVLPDRALDRLASLPVQRGGERRGIGSLARSYAARLADVGTGTDADQYLALVGSMTSQTGLGALRWRSDPHAARLDVAARLGLELSERHPLRGIQGFELATYLPGDLLVKEDRATMAVGLEARVPLLDREFVALADRMPDVQKASLRAGKLPLRKLARRLLGSGAGRGRKRGFAVPLRDLFAERWRDEAIDWFSSCHSQLVNGRAAAALVSRTPSVASDLWALAALVAWEQRLEQCRKTARSCLAKSAPALPRLS